MDKKNNSDAVSENLAVLCRQVEGVANIRCDTPKQFDRLSHEIYNRTGVMLSTMTLKRIWGYVHQEVSHRRTTLDALAQFCGWSSYEDFAAGHTPEIESGNLGREYIRADENIHPGERVKLFWNPGRVCEIEYLGSQRWIVKDSLETRLQSGDTFSCALIVSGEPLYIDSLQQPGTHPGVYVCGRKSGVHFERLPS